VGLVKPPNSGKPVAVYSEAGQIYIGYLVPCVLDTWRADHNKVYALHQPHVSKWNRHPHGVTIRLLTTDVIEVLK